MFPVGGRKGSRSGTQLVDGPRELRLSLGRNSGPQPLVREHSQPLRSARRISASPLATWFSGHKLSVALPPEVRCG